MKERNHIALLAPQLSMKSDFIQNLLKGIVPEQLNNFNNKRGALFSSATLEKFILEEAKHDDFTLSANEHRSIRTFSSGEQRKALLNHLIATKPDFLILDSVFDMLDVKSSANLMQRLTRLSASITIVQIVKRKDTLLPFIHHAICIENNQITFSGSIAKCTEFANKKTYTLQGTLPATLGESNTIKNPIVQFNSTKVSYGDKPILKNINWTIKHGDFWQLKGPNGAGKTTLLTMITGDNPKAYGQDIVLFGHKRGTGESIWEIKKNIGYVTPAMTTLFRGWNTVEKMVISGLVDSIGLYKKPTALQKRTAGEWIKLIGLEAQKHSRFSTLNEAQQCMVLIARSMIKHPILLILDEPTHGLDDYNASIVSSLVNKIAEEGNTTVVFVSHHEEPGLKPKQVFELVPGSNGSRGNEKNAQ